MPSIIIYKQKTAYEMTVERRRSTAARCHAVANLDRNDALLFGRVTYEMMEAAIRPPPRTGTAVIPGVSVGDFAQRLAERSPGGDAEFGKDAVEVGADGAWGEVELRRDLFVGVSGGSQFGDGALLGAERDAVAGGPFHRGAGCA